MEGDEEGRVGGMEGQQHQERDGDGGVEEGRERDGKAVVLILTIGLFQQKPLSLAFQMLIAKRGGGNVKVIL